MASVSDSSLNFFTKATPSQWSFILNLYREVFKVHAQETRGSRKNGPAELIKLDIWYQEQLPGIIRSRKEHQLFYDELVQLTKWKLLRGRFRPSLLDLVKTNTETAVKNVTKKAFRKISNISSAISALTTLKGIGPATASAILVSYAPDIYPYMADENMLSTPGVEVTDYTSSEYMNYVEKISLCVEKLKKLNFEGNWTPHKVELALWTHYQIKKYNLSLLDNMPTNEVLDSSNYLRDEEENNEVSNSNDNNLVGSSLEVSKNNSNLHDVDEDSSQNCSESSMNNNGKVSNSEISSNVSKYNSRDENTNELSSTEFCTNSKNVSNLEDEVSNLSSNISFNSINDDQSRDSVLGKICEDSSSNNVSSTNGQGSNNFNKNLKLSTNFVCEKQAIENSNSHDNFNTESNSNLSLQNFSTTDSSEKFSISSSYKNSNTINSSDDSELCSSLKNKNVNSESSFLKLKKSIECVNNFNDNALDLNGDEDNCDPIIKRQKTIN